MARSNAGDAAHQTMPGRAGGEQAACESACGTPDAVSFAKVDISAPVEEVSKTVKLLGSTTFVSEVDSPTPTRSSSPPFLNDQDRRQVAHRDWFACHPQPVSGRCSLPLSCAMSSSSSLRSFRPMSRRPALALLPRLLRLHLCMSLAWLRTWSAARSSSRPSGRLSPPSWAILSCRPSPRILLASLCCALPARVMTRPATMRMR